MGMGMPAEKAKDFKGTLKRVLKYLKPFWWGIALIALLSICSSLFTVISPRVQGNAITIIEQGVTSGEGINYTALYRTLLFMGGIYVLSSLFSFLQQFIVATISQKLVFNLRRDIERKLSKLPLKFYDLAYTRRNIEPYY